MTDHIIAAIGLLTAGAVITGVVQSLFASRKDMGKRLGRVEKRQDVALGYKLGYRDGVRAGKRENRRERDGT